MMNQLYKSYTLKDCTLSNRVVMAPMTRCRAIDNIPNDLMAEYYGQRAGAGLIVTEGVAPSANGLGYARIPGIFTHKQVDGWKKTTKVVHDKGGKIFLQLMHTGRVSHQDNMSDDAIIVAPSALAAPGEMYTDQNGMQDYPVPQAMSIDQIKETIDEFKLAAQNAMEAGFDGIELHGANGYLIEQFISPITNHRDDEWGGSIENRIRFAVEVARVCAEAIGAQKVGMRISPYGAANGMGAFDTVDETFLTVVQQLNNLDVAYVHVVDHSARGAPEVPKEIKRGIRENFTGTLILCGGYDGERAEQDLQNDKADLIAFGRPFISNPDLVEKMKAGKELTKPRSDLFYTPGPEGYTDY